MTLQKKFPVSATSAPGQIIIPISLRDFFPDFVNAETKANGARQEECFFDLLFVGSAGRNIPVHNARAILYIPAPNHPRPNQEIRFTFRNKDVFSLLQAGDILVFEETPDLDTPFIVKQIKITDAEYSNYSGRFGTSD